MKRPISFLKSQQKGFSLIEVLITFVILAVGLLGIAALQVQSARYNHDAYLRSQISVIMYDLVDRMRVNRKKANDYLVSGLSFNITAPACDPTAAGDANNDIQCLQYNIITNSVLPNNITADISSIADEYQIQFTWPDPEGGSRTISYRFTP